MSLFIIGGTGYIGRRTVDLALAGGTPVTVMTRDTAKAKELESRGVKAVVGDLLKNGSWQKELAEAEHVIHIAAPPAQGRKITNRAARKYQRNHYEMTVRMLDHLNRRRLKKLVYVASASFFGDTGDGEPKTEQYCSTPKGLGRYIAPSVHLLPEYVDRGLPIVTAFPGQVYGPDLWFSRLVLEPLSKYEPIRVLRGRNPIWSPMHIEDCARACLHLLDKGLPGEDYLLAGSRPIASDDFFSIAAKELDAPDRKREVSPWLCQWRFGPVLMEHTEMHTNFANGKLRSTGFHYRYPTLESGVAAAVKAWRSNRQTGPAKS